MGVAATNLETVPVRETFQGQMAWEGEVEVFEVGHPSGATRCYGGATLGPAKIFQNAT